MFYFLSNSGGGGERVLWCAIKAIEMNIETPLECIIYSGDPSPQEDILLKVSQRFGIYFSNKVKIQIINLTKRHYVEAWR